MLNISLSKVRPWMIIKGRIFRLLKQSLGCSIINIIIKEDMSVGYIIRSRFRLLILAVVIGLVSQIVLPPWLKTVKAEPQGKAWSWAESKPTVFSSTKMSNPDNWCMGFFQTEQIAGESGSKQVCMTSRSNVKFGLYITGNAFLPAVGFSYDSKMYRVNGICGQLDDCIYLPGSDTLVTKQYLVNNMVRSLVIYRNFSRRLKPYLNMNGLLPTPQFNFDSSNPDYVFQSTVGFAWPIGGMRASDNGQWLVVEIRQRGIGLLNIETLEMRRISNMAFSYGTGFNPTTELAVSNDGQHVALMGLNSGLTVFDINSDCGDEVTDYNIGSVGSVVAIDRPCKASSISTGDFINSFFYAISPKFNEEGGELNFYAISYAREYYEVSLRASGYTPRRLGYLALGDSFTSGEGETDDKYYLNGTNDEYEKCHVSMRSYPFLISDSMKIDPLNMASVACSGAETKDIVGDDATYSGQGDRLGEERMKLNDTEIILAQAEAKKSFLPGRVHQESFVEKYQPKVITIGIGGNDAGFMSKLKTCLGADTCSWASNSEDKEQTAIEIKKLFGTLLNTYQGVHDASPDSKIYAIGYPRIIDADEKCNLLNGYLLDSTERQFMNEGITYLNQVIATAARASGIRFIDIEGSYGDQVLCGKSKPSAMNAIRLGDDGAISEKLEWFKPIGNESFHPNSLGHTFATNSIVSSVSNLMTFEYCNGNSTICPDRNAVAPEPSSYWIPDIPHNYPAQTIANYMSDQDNAPDNLGKNISLESNSLAPNSVVDIEITSDPISLGQYTANNDGSLDVDIILPADIKEGYHTVHLYGTSYSGESIELYQAFGYSQPHAIINEKASLSNDSKVVNDAGALLANIPERDNKLGLSVVASNNEVNNDEVNSGGPPTDLASVDSEPKVMGASVAANKSLVLAENNPDKIAKNVTTKWTIMALLAILVVVGVLMARLSRRVRAR